MCLSLNTNHEQYLHGEFFPQQLDDSSRNQLSFHQFTHLRPQRKGLQPNITVCITNLQTVNINKTSSANIYFCLLQRFTLHACPRNVSYGFCRLARILRYIHQHPYSLVESHTVEKSLFLTSKQQGSLDHAEIQRTMH